MITVRQRTALITGTKHIVANTATPSLPPSVARPVHNGASGITSTTMHSQSVVANGQLTSGMQRIFELYKSGAYFAACFSLRSEQRHRKFFRKLGIDLRKPYCPSSVGLFLSEPPTKHRTKPMRNEKKKGKLLPAPESAPPTSEPTCRKSKCASEALSRAHRTRVQRHRMDRTVGLGAMARAR